VKTLCLLLLIPMTALASHDAQHRCDYSIPGYVPNRFEIQQNGSVFDTVTGLEWQRCSLGESWSEELQQCLGYPQQANWRDTLFSVVLFNQEQLALGRDNNWRLPNIKELTSIVSMHCATPSIDTEIFPDAASSYWSSTPYMSNTVQSLVDGVVILENAAWNVNFSFTAQEQALGISQLSAARLVRNAGTTQ